MGRPSQPMITKEGAVEAALKIIDEKGMDGLSLQLVAKELGVKAPSLYYHFKNKAEMLEAVARLILERAALTKSKKSTNWKDQMVEISLSARRAMLAHPKAAPLLLEFYPRHTNLPAYDYWASQYQVPPSQKMLILEGLEKLTFGSAMLGAMSRAKGVQPMPDFDAKEFPHLAQAMKANKRSEEKLFVEAIKRYLEAF